ncbi:MAG: MBL fold metallo-hydrolase [Ignavibacteriales bacterium]|nr:MBL fold metallo-hydrolase [Ignavibacteriales bacterium]MCF8316274.1 MBL fold metallo-hydrolase [Ignavibacteriales bacterium]MCF8437858.1 MBL fold metallo-hydrolase [Ignavibacteriales bacterium]
MFFQHVYEKGLAQASYIIGCQATGEAIVIDPKRDISTYLEIAEIEKLKIRYITETHIHADFLSGARELAAATGGELLLSDEGGDEWKYDFPHKGLRDGSIIKLGNLSLEVIHTPGHTPEHISFLLTDKPAGDVPVMVFTGDFVFVGDVGRPDLLEEAAGFKGTKVDGAKQMFASLKKFRNLPDFVQVWPGHGAGSACGKALGAVPSSTVGYEKFVNWALKMNDEAEFVEKLLEGQPEPPRYFAMMKKLNKTGPEVLGGEPHPAKLTLGQFKSALESGITLVDTRDKISFAGGHIPGAINIRDDSSFSTWAGWMLNYDAPFLLVASDERIAEITRGLIRIGLDKIHGYISDLNIWTNQGFELETLNQISVCDLEEKLETGEFEIIDVRGKSEYEKERISGAVNIPAGYIARSLDIIPKDKNVVLHCAAGDRSSIAASILLKMGYSNVYNLTGGISAWKQKGFRMLEGKPSDYHKEIDELILNN